MTLVRIITMPISQLIWGAQPTWRDEIAAASLSGPLKMLIERVVSHTRLKPAERLDVARELIAHFADGIAAGETEADLIAAFGDERTASRLIRKAKIRCRSALWHTMRFMGRVFAVLLVIYVGMIVRFMTLSPEVKVDYTALINEQVEAVPMDDRAWPLYRQPILALRDVPTVEGVTGYRLTDLRPEDEAWPKAVAWLETKRTAIEQIHQAAAKPSLGFVYGPQGSVDDPELYPNLVSQMAGNPQSVVGFISVLLPNLSDMRLLANVLAVDALRAAEVGDAARFEADVTALLGMGDQLATAADRVLVTQLVAVGIRALALDQLIQTMQRHPELLDDSALGRLAHRLALLPEAGEGIDLTGEQYFFRDVLQRVYSDDGKGDGTITREGIKYLQSLGAVMASRPVPSLFEETTTIVGSPVAMMAMPSRRELTEFHDKAFELTRQWNSRPAHQATGESPVNQWVARVQMSTIDRARYSLILTFMPSLSHVRTAFDRVQGERDGALIGIALELYRRQHGDYPASLDALSPRYLPAAPLDRITGHPLHYRMVNGAPLVYSAGADRDDDGGRLAAYRGQTLSPDAAARWGLASASSLDGDWVIYGWRRPMRGIEPEESEPDAGQLNPAQPDATEPDSAHPESIQPESAPPVSAEAGSAQPGSAQPVSAQAGSTQAGSDQSGSAAPDAQ